MSDMRYIDIPGSKTHQLPPLLVHAAEWQAEDESIELVSVLPEAEDMLGFSDALPEEIERRKYELALRLTEEYKGLVAHWLWGDSVLEWIRQCEITFECEDSLRSLLHPDVWPHASRASFVTLLVDKGIASRQVAVERAVGLRLTFRQPPPIACFSNQFLFYLNSAVADSAYNTWSCLALREPSLLPPHRFQFEILEMGNCAQRAFPPITS
jgi:hypothetical protein